MNGGRALWLSLELASDGNFQRLLHQADRVAPGDNGQSSFRMPSLLGAGYTYFWRVRAQDGANMGPGSSISSFKLVEPVVLEPPAPREPIGFDPLSLRA